MENKSSSNDREPNIPDALDLNAVLGVQEPKEGELTYQYRYYFTCRYEALIGLTDDRSLERSLQLFIPELEIRSDAPFSLGIKTNRKFTLEEEKKAGEIAVEHFNTKPDIKPLNLRVKHVTCIKIELPSSSPKS